MMAGCRRLNDKFSAVVISAEDYLSPNERYSFDFKNIGKLHEQCFKQFIFAMQAEFNIIFVDNTNTTSVEIAPYVLAAGAFGYTHNIITFRCRDIQDVNLLTSRNRHSVDFNEIFAQHNRICDRLLMPWWNAVDVGIEVEKNES
jgi:hypothetical protein